jgi:hypothetical protein
MKPRIRLHYRRKGDWWAEVTTGGPDRLWTTPRFSECEFVLLFLRLQWDVIL